MAKAEKASDIDFTIPLGRGLKDAVSRIIDEIEGIEDREQQSIAIRTLGYSLESAGIESEMQ